MFYSVDFLLFPIIFLICTLQKILVEFELSGGLLNTLLGRKNSLDDLFYLDEDLYRGLMKLKHFANEGGDVESLDLYFTVRIIFCSFFALYP
jgi:hypothetical protein